jgi:hypothetical protein
MQNMEPGLSQKMEVAAVELSQKSLLREIAPFLGKVVAFKVTFAPDSKFQPTYFTSGAWSFEEEGWVYGRVAPEWQEWSSVGYGPALTLVRRAGAIPHVVALTQRTMASYGASRLLMREITAVEKDKIRRAFDDKEANWGY